MSDHSDFVSLGDVVTERSERINDPSSSDVSRFIGLEHFDSGSLSIRRFGSTDDLESAMKLCKAGDTLVARRNVYLKRAALTEIDAICSGDAIVLHETSDLVPGFLPIILNSSYFWDYANENADGSMSKRLSVKHLKDYRFILPSKEQQQTVTQLVWGLENLIIQFISALNRFDLLVKSRFIEMFGNDTSNYPEAMISDMLSNVSGGGTPSKSHPEYYGGDIPWVTSKDVKQFYIDDSEIHITEEGLNNSSAKMIPANSIILVVRSGILKHTLPVSVSTRPVSINQDLKGLEVKSDVNPIYLAYALKKMETKIIGESRATTVDNVEIKRILNLLIPKPPYEIQNQFADFVRQVDKSKVVLLKHIEDTKSLQQSIINSCFEANEDV